MSRGRRAPTSARRSPCATRRRRSPASSMTVPATRLARRVRAGRLGARRGASARRRPDAETTGVDSATTLLVATVSVDEDGAVAVQLAAVGDSPAFAPDGQALRSDRGRAGDERRPDRRWRRGPAPRSRARLSGWRLRARAGDASAAVHRRAGAAAGAAGRERSGGRSLASWRHPPDVVDFARLLDFSRSTYDDDRSLVAVWAPGPMSALVAVSSKSRPAARGAARGRSASSCRSRAFGRPGPGLPARVRARRARPRSARGQALPPRAPAGRGERAAARWWPGAGRSSRRGRAAARGSPHGRWPSSTPVRRPVGHRDAGCQRAVRGAVRDAERPARARAADARAPARAPTSTCSCAVSASAWTRCAGARSPSG